MDPILEQLLKKKMLEDPFLFQKFPWMYRNPWEGGQFGEGGSFPSIGLDMGGVPFGGALTGGMYSYPSQSQQLQSQSPQIPIESLAKMGVKGYQALTKGGSQSSAVFPADEGMASLPVTLSPGEAVPAGYPGISGDPTSLGEGGMSDIWRSSPQSSAVFPVEEGMASLPTAGIGNLASKGVNWLTKGLISNPFGAFMGGASALGAETPGYSSMGAGLGGLLGMLAGGPIGGVLGGLGGMFGGGLFGGDEDTPQEKAIQLITNLGAQRGGAMMSDIESRGLGQTFDPGYKTSHPMMSIPDYSQIGEYPNTFGLSEADISNMMSQGQFLSPSAMQGYFNEWSPAPMGSPVGAPFYYTDVPVGQISPDTVPAFDYYTGQYDESAKGN